MIKKSLLTNVFYFFNIVAKMTKRIHSVQNDQKIIDALKKLPNCIYDKKHDLKLYLNNNKSRSNETRFEHISKKYHELRVRDIESIPEGINNYIEYVKNKHLKDTYSYLISRQGKDKGFIKVDILVDKFDKKKGYIKTIYVSYRWKKKR